MDKVWVKQLNLITNNKMTLIKVCQQIESVKYL